MSRVAKMHRHKIAYRIATLVFNKIMLNCGANIGTLIFNKIKLYNLKIK